MGKMIKLAAGAAMGLYALLQLLVVTEQAMADPQGMQARTSESGSIVLACVAAALSALLLRSALRRPSEPPARDTLGQIIKLCLGAPGLAYALLLLFRVVGELAALAATSPRRHQEFRSLGISIGVLCIVAPISIALLRSALKRPPEPPADE